METILIIIGSLLLGIILGLKLPKKWMKKNERFTLLGVLSLLFVMGMKIGQDEEVIENIKVVGFLGVAYAVFTVMFSIVIVLILTKYLLRVRE